MKATFKGARLLAGITQIEAAKEFGIDVKTLRSIENGSKVDGDMLKKMAAFYRIDPSDFIVEEETKVFYTSKAQ